MNKKKLIFGSFIFLVLVAMYLPIILLSIFSFSEARIMNFGDFQFGMGLYRELLANDMLVNAIINTIFIAAISAFIATLIGTIAAVGINNMRKRGKTGMMILTLIPIINASIVTSFALVLFFVEFGFFTGYLRLIMAHVLISMPIVILVILPRLRTLDSSLFDAAMDLGAKPSQALFSVIIPQLIPAMIGAFLVGFTLSLDDYIITQYNSGDINTISTLIFTTAKGPLPAVYRALSAVVFFLVILVLVVINFKVTKKRRYSGDKVA